MQIPDSIAEELVVGRQDQRGCSSRTRFLNLCDLANVVLRRKFYALIYTV